MNVLHCWSKEVLRDLYFYDIIYVISCPKNKQLFSLNK